jgi:hypothetical protein
VDCGPDPGADTCRVGIWSALAYAGLLIALDIAFVAMALLVGAGEWEGMQVYARTYRGIAFLPQAIGLAAIPPLIVLLAAVHVGASPSHKPWSLAALSFGTAHAAVLGGLYFIQVAILLPALGRGEAQGLDQLAFANPRSVAWGLDHFAWALLGIALLSLAPVFEGGGLDRWVRRLLVVNGVANALLVPAFGLDLSVLTLMVAGVSWVVALPLNFVVIALTFRRRR